MDNLGQLFKFSTEAQLNVLRQDSVMFSLEGLDILKEVSVLDDFHIYAIVARPRYSFELSSLSTDKEGINITILNENRKNFCEIKGFKYNFILHGIELDDFNYEFIHINCEPPYTRIDLTLYPSEDLVAYLSKKIKSFKSEDLIQKAMHEFNISLDVEDLICKVYIKNNISYDIEVLYIGQAQGREANRGAIERLKSHETLQKILIDCHTKFTDKRIFIMLFKFSEQQIMLMNGWEDEFLSSKEEDERHHRQLVNDAIDLTLNTNKDRERQVINITEAALINYFKPPYNCNFVDNFPSHKHLSYKRYYDLEYNAISIELGLEGRPQPVLFSENNKIQSVWDFVEYEMFPEERASMYDIFRSSARHKDR